MADEQSGVMDGLKMVPAGTQGQPVTGQPVTGDAVAGAALPAGGEPAKPEASSPQGFDPKSLLAQIQMVLDERDRRLQSSLDKRDGHIRKMLAERQGQVAQIGEKAKALGVTDQQVQSLQSALLNDALAEALKEEDQPSPQPSSTGEGVNAEVAAAEAKAEAMAELAGLTADDPEVKLITGYTTPAEYLQKVQAACKAKLARELAPSQPLPNGRGSTVGAAAVMGPGGGAANVLPPIEKVDTGRLWREALQEARNQR